MMLAHEAQVFTWCHCHIDRIVLMRSNCALFHTPLKALTFTLVSLELN